MTQNDKHVIVNKQKLINIANTTRKKNGKIKNSITLDQINSAIDTIPTPDTVFDTIKATEFYPIISLHEYNFNSSVKEVSSGTTITSTVKCNIGDVIVCCFATRNCVTPTLSNGWTLLSVSNAISGDETIQRLNWATKIAESAEESVTITQTSSGRMYVNLVSLPSTVTVTVNEYNYFNSGASNGYVVNKLNGLTIWGATAPYWSSGSLWTVSNFQFLIQLPSSTSPRLLTGLDESNDETVTFHGVGTSSGVIIGSLTLAGVDSFTKEMQ